MLICLFGISAHAMEYKAVSGDSVAKIAKATNATPAEVIKLNKGKIKAPLFWLYIGQTYELPALPSSTKSNAGVATVAKAHTVDAPRLNTAPKATAPVRVSITKIDAPIAQLPTTLSTPITPKVNANVAFTKQALWSNPEQVCSSCALDDFLSANYSKEVGTMLKQKVDAGDFQHVQIASGDRFEAMQFPDVTRQHVVARWEDRHTEPAKLFTAIYGGMEYSLIYPKRSGNWSKMTPAPDVGEVLVIKESVEQLTGPSAQTMQLALLIWRERHGVDIPTPHAKDAVDMQYASTLALLNDPLSEAVHEPEGQSASNAPSPHERVVTEQVPDLEEKSQTTIPLIESLSASEQIAEKVIPSDIADLQIIPSNQKE